MPSRYEAVSSAGYADTARIPSFSRVDRVVGCFFVAKHRSDGTESRRSWMDQNGSVNENGCCW